MVVEPGRGRVALADTELVKVSAVRKSPKVVSMLRQAQQPQAQQPGRQYLKIDFRGYIILPIDLIPDAIPVIGWTDDLASVTGVVIAVAAYSNFDMANLDAVIDAEK